MQPPPAKRQRVGKLVPEVDFAASAGTGPITLTVAVPIDGGNPAWNLMGQTLSLAVEGGVMTKVGEIKKLICAELGSIPASKFQVKYMAYFMKDKLSLAHYNVGGGAALDIKVKSRGGRR